VRKKEWDGIDRRGKHDSLSVESRFSSATSRPMRACPNPIPKSPRRTKKTADSFSIRQVTTTRRVKVNSDSFVQESRRRLTLKCSEELKEIEDSEDLCPNERSSAREEFCKGKSRQFLAPSVIFTISSSSPRSKMHSSREERNGNSRKESIRNLSDFSCEVVPQSAQR